MHSTRGVGENVVAMETRFIILHSGEGLTSFNKNNRANFSGEKNTMKLPGMSILRKQRKLL